MNSTMKSPFLNRIEEEPKRMDSTKRGILPPVAGGMVVAPQPNKPEKKATEDIDESAEAFIRKFRQQLLLQRMESIENYKEMLHRGT